MLSFNQYLLLKISQPSQQKAPACILQFQIYITITSNEIAQLLSGLVVHKAPGPDIIGPLVLKELYDIIVPILETILNASL